MPNELASRVQRIKPSPTLAIAARAEELKAAGKNIISLSVGEPDFDTPAFVKEAAIKAINEGFTKYTAVDGIKGLKQAIINKFARDNKLNYDFKQILVSCGAKHSIFNLFAAVLEAGDEVIIPAPYWVSYPDIALLSDAKPVLVSAGIEQHFKITPAQLEAAITPKTRLVMLNSPSNPTGTAYTLDELKALGQVLLKHPGIIVASDDIYEHTQWTKEPFANILMACPELYDRTVVINGVSKSYAMTGWRIGYAAGPVKLIAAMTKIQSQSTSNATSIAQIAAEAALNGDQSCIGTMTKAYKERHDFVLGELRKMPGIKCLPCDGTFYIFPNIDELLAKTHDINDDLEFAEFLLNVAEIAVVPGSAFGAPGYFRISYATSMEKLQEAMKRMHLALAKLV
ncbi:MAG: pyridoxal phosphate-dependent aminotransferase [Gammaproteobacteria bacterium]|nr:pyridoxal phosphate-dependent aminotransferase [Gammaproteobacteria bacterium]